MRAADALASRLALVVRAHLDACLSRDAHDSARVVADLDKVLPSLFRERLALTIGELKPVTAHERVTVDVRVEQLLDAISSRRV